VQLASDENNSIDMPQRKAPLFTVLCLLMIAAAAAAQPPQLERMTELRLSAIDEAGPPRVLENHILITLKPRPAPRYVAAVFAHENFRHKHVFYRNRNDVYFLMYPIPEGLEQVEYRLVADGLWGRDPQNPVARVDGGGVPISVFELPEPREAPAESPVLHDERQVEFYFETEPGRRVFVRGSFNNWDPYMHRMEEVSPGRYRLRLRVPPGTHYYEFVSAGQRLPDPLNEARAYDQEGHRISVVEVP